MKFLRIGKAGQEIPVALDKDGKYRNLSSVIKDLNPESINFKTLNNLCFLFILFSVYNNFCNNFF